MKQAELVVLSMELCKEGIANTYEYPGYINIQYRAHNVVVGIESPEMLVQINTDDGRSLDTPESFVIDLDTLSAISDTLPLLKKCFAEAYSIIDKQF